MIQGSRTIQKDDVPAPVEQKADAMLAEKIATMTRDLTLEFIKGYENASCKQELVIQYEYFSPNQLSSVYDHGGDELYVVTEELGYGHIRYLLSIFHLALPL